MGPANGRRSASRARIAALALVLLFGRAGPSGAAGVVSADQVCAAGVDPCKVTSVVPVEDGAVLDFGTRAVQLSGSGQFNFGAGSGSVLCGPFSAATAGTAINARGTSPEGSSESGSVRVEARRLCSAGATALPCVNSTECQLGSCSVRRCSLRPTRTCTSDESCTVGPCGANKRCAGATGIVRCNTNADCDYGTCPEQLTCANRASSPVACSVDADCDFGACTSGAASISMGGAIAGNSGFPAIVTLRAADSVSILKAVNLSSTDTESDGGELSIEAAAGGVTVTAKITATGGSAAQGGSVDVQAGEDAILAEDITVAGGDFDGGSVLVRAGRDVSVGRSVLASATSGAGFGGEILVAAGRDLLVGSAASSSGVLTASGHTDPSGNAGDGGTLDLSAGRHANLGAGSRLTGRGSDPDGNGAQVFVEAGGDAALAGDVDAGSDGQSGGGGVVEVSTGGVAGVATTASFDVSGGSGGRVTAGSAGAMTLAGSVTAAASGDGAGGSATFVSAADATVSATLATAGDGGLLGVQACRVTLTGEASFENDAVAGENRLTARESMKLLAGSGMTAPAGANVLVYRTNAKPPLLQGTVSPAAQTVVDGALPGCPVCGNLEIDAGESCDDGNTTGGDGCSTSCQNENCLLQTIAPGHPEVALCEDGDPCTADVCNTSLDGGTCQHPAKDCSDGFACTADTCDSGVCVHATDDSLCDDGNVCTDDFCSADTGCRAVANDNACRDGDKCTRDDRCVAKVCTGTPSSVCAECGDGVVDETEDCDDGDALFVSGQECSGACAWIPCGKPTASSGVAPRAGDALFALRAAVKLVTCSPRTCDADGSGVVAATDALRILRAAVGLAVTLRCPV